MTANGDDERILDSQETADELSKYNLSAFPRKELPDVMISKTIANNSSTLMLTPN